MFLSPLKFASKSSVARQGFSGVFNTFSKAQKTQSLLRSARSFHQSSNAKHASVTPLRLGLLFGLTGSTYFLASNRAVYHNDFASATNAIVDKTGKVLNENKPVVVRQRFGGKLNYHELSIGSITGLFFGIIVGKLSHILVFVTVSGYLGLQYLQSKGIITLPTVNRVVKVAGSRVDVDDLVWNNQSFKLSFVSAFLVAAYNV
ncbi:hypothetical protein BABINDRAFT_163257 [Babjeviella inositovora NRRL Y-12698]|uniref:Uncharacterized protein n=1 Tax=Babjeviella inositovora NRRL Y-12698 TaxID=984486 RepID=A0A1E3QLC0_9ASCO|nr:uncharacterized protein BABINDRAFT_163257 [Babjeviella inositovora NRRL Y-12698]ODQ77882.1 hypothetical protein BABINDRAFT_163257 [Babjeviella inositovora NRRL Y-12698]